MDRVALIYRFLSGEASQSEKQELDEWIAKSEANREEFEDIKLLWENSPLPSDTEQDENGFEKIRQRIQQQTWFRNPVGAQFNDTVMNEVIKMLEKKYHIQIEVNNPQLLRCNFTATLYKIQDKQTALRSIEHSLDVAFIAQKKNKYRAVGNGCSSL
jgi:ferric-dicitrate binding protein FerR (iron transport regulator)